MSTSEATRVRTGADALVAALEAHGVEIVFGIPGQHALSLWEALRGSPIRPIVVRHERVSLGSCPSPPRAAERKRATMTSHCRAAILSVWQTKRNRLVRFL